MSEPLTAAGGDDLVALFIRAYDVCYLREPLERLVASTAARAVDEALSVEALAAALDKLEVVGWVAMRYGKFNMAYYEKLAAALVAHLRGPR
jgi:hypothetical protein